MVKILNSARNKSNSLCYCIMLLVISERGGSCLIKGWVSKSSYVRVSEGWRWPGGRGLTCSELLTRLLAPDLRQTLRSEGGHEGHSAMTATNEDLCSSFTAAEVLIGSLLFRGYYFCRAADTARCQFHLKLQPMK